MWLRRSEPRPSNVIFFSVCSGCICRQTCVHTHSAVVRGRPGDSMAPLLPHRMEVWSVG